MFGTVGDVISGAAMGLIVALHLARGMFRTGGRAPR